MNVNAYYGSEELGRVSLVHTLEIFTNAGFKVMLVSGVS